MTGMRGVLVTAGLTMLTVVGGGVLVPPAAWAAPEHKISWSVEEVAGVREGIARGDLACGVGNVAVGGGVAVAAGAGPFGLVAGTVVGLAGLLCGHNDPELRDAVDEAYFKECAIDAYLTDGPLSYDATYRYVVCP
jgi:hypothetical protein